MVHQERIGASNYFWSFPGEAAAKVAGEIAKMEKRLQVGVGRLCRIEKWVPLLLFVERCTGRLPPWVVVAGEIGKLEKRLQVSRCACVLLCRLPPSAVAAATVVGGMVAMMGCAAAAISTIPAAFALAGAEGCCHAVMGANAAVQVCAPALVCPACWTSAGALVRSMLRRPTCAHLSCIAPPLHRCRTGRRSGRRCRRRWRRAEWASRTA